MRNLTVMLLAAAAFAATALALDPGQTEFEHNGWFRYTNQSTKFQVTKPTSEKFALERGYLRFSHQWSSMFFTKFTVDIFSSDKYAEGATVRLKEGYADIAVPFLKDFFLTPGLQKHYFGLIYSWDYTHPDKSLADDRGVCASADYGVTLNGFLPAGLGELQLGVYNGEGYKYAGKYVNTSPELLGNLRLTPFSGLMVGFSAFTNPSDMSLYKNDKKGRLTEGTNLLYMNADTANTNRFAVAPVAKIAFGPFSLLGEYVSYGYTREFSYYTINRDSTGQVVDSTLVTKTKDYQMGGIDLMPLVTLAGRRLEVYGRFTTWQRKDQSGDSMPVNKSHSFVRYGAGANYHFIRRDKGKPGLEFQFAWSREQSQVENADPKDVFMAQVRFEWNLVVNKL